MRVLGLVLAITFGASAAFSDDFMGRKVEITDGRGDGTHAAPLIIAMHGFLGTSSNMRKKTSFDSLARKHGLVVAYPNGLRRRWNDGRSAQNGVDDVAYLSALIDRFVADGVADPDRVFLAGHSNGGGMAMRMACDTPRQIAGIAVIATKVLAAFQCRNGSPVPAVFFHGTEDPVAPHAGRPSGHRLGATLSAEASLSLWSARNKCNGTRNTRIIDRRNDGTQATIIPYARCRAPLTYVLIDGHGHAWPGAGPRLTRLQGPATKELDAAVLSWAFFARL